MIGIKDIYNHMNTRDIESPMGSGVKDMVIGELKFCASCIRSDSVDVKRELAKMIHNQINNGLSDSKNNECEGQMWHKETGLVDIEVDVDKKLMDAMKAYMDDIIEGYLKGKL